MPGKAMRKALIAVLACSLIVVSAVGALCLHNEWIRLGENERARSKITEKADEIRLDRQFNEFYGVDDFETDLPILFIETGNNAISGDTPVMARLSILNAGNDGSLHSPEEQPDVSIDISIKQRGASSRRFDKRQYRIEFFTDAQGKNSYNYDFLQMGKASEWVLNGPFLDKTLARNYLAYQLGREIMEWAPDCRYLELFVDGQYQGVYLAVEPVTNGDTRLRLSKFGLLSGEAAYIVSRDRVNTDTKPLENFGKTAGYTSNDLYVQYPGKNSLTDAEYRWITEDVSRFERVLYGSDFKDPLKGYAAYIDIDNFADYFIINEIFMNHDASLLSTYAYKELGGKLKLVIWDYNNAYDNYQWFREDFEEFFLLHSPWFDRLLQDRAFVDRVVARYYELRETTFSTEHMTELLDSTTALLGSATDRNFRVWDFSFKIGLLADPGRELKSYEEAMAQLKEAIVQRFEFLDAHITDLYENCD